MTLLNEIKEGILISWDTLRANKMRSSLTTLGIVIGVVTVTLMGTAIDGLNAAFRMSISAIGADVFYVQRGAWMNNSQADWLKTQKRQPISVAQAAALERQLVSARAVVPVAGTRNSVSYKNRRSDSVRVLGTTENFVSVSSVSVTEGRFLSQGETDGGRPVVVIGWDIATNLFQGDSPIGKSIRIGSGAFEVIGVLDKQGNFLGSFSLDNQVFIPLRQFISSFNSFPNVEVQVKARSIEALEESKEELRGVMRKIRGVRPGAEDDFAINQQDNFIQSFNRVAGTIATVGLFITGLSLFVGGIGIMNIMFVSVAERTKEIGVRKAIGAKKRTILLQFLIEAASICLFGGLIALAIAWPMTLVISKFMPSTMSFKMVGLALLVSLLTGVISGFLPAWRAARMKPVDALRNE
ncbi:MAG: ABC transporter permease [Opitutaceae bacterium]|nr:ABC transporter permease [Verrucomicrobiales bacterium]